MVKHPFKNMKFTSFLKSLLPSFEKEQVLEDIRITLNEYKEVTIPAYESTIGLLNDMKLKSAGLDNFDKVFRRNNPGHDRNLFGGILEGLQNAEKNLHYVGDQIGKTYNEEVAGLGMTYLKATLLQYAELAGFVSKYARKLLVYTFVIESAEYEGNSLKVSESLTKAELKWIEENMLNFAQAFKVVSSAKGKLEKNLSDVPDIVITDDNEEILVKSNSSKVDPMAMRLIPIWLNPIYHIGMFVAEWQANRYKASKEELKVIQLRKLYLERLIAGKPDAQIEKEIAYLESRAQELNYKINKIEKSVK